MPNRAGIVIAGESNPGLVRKNNEDSFCLLALPDRATALAAVADGVGGHCNGALASRICCRDLSAAYETRVDSALDTPELGEQFLRDTLCAVNTKIFRRNYFEQLPRPMGTTVIAALFLEKEIVIAGAGDSRFYELMRTGELIQHSTDHTLTAEFVREFGRRLGNDRYDYKNVISRAVGPRSDLDLEVHHLPRRPASRYLLCSDGAYRSIEPATLAKQIEEAETPRDAVNTVMREALLGGGRDNITVVAAFSMEG